MQGMAVPLIAKSFIDLQSNKQKLEIWTNGEKHIVDPPFLPYIISQVELPFTEGEVKGEKLAGYPLSTLRKTEMFKYSFPNTGAIAKLNKELEAPQNEMIKRAVCDNHTEFRERIIIDMPDYFKRFANINPLKLFCFDIETLMFNNRDYTSIISIAWGTDQDHVTSMQAPVYWRSSEGFNVKEYGTIDDLLLRLEENNEIKTSEDIIVEEAQFEAERVERRRREEAEIENNRLERLAEILAPYDSDDIRRGVIERESLEASMLEKAKREQISLAKASQNKKAREDAWNEEKRLFNEDKNAWHALKIEQFTRDKTPYVKDDDEINLINEFFMALRQANPDIVTGFNHKDFDFIRIFDRCSHYGIDYQVIARSNGKVEVGEKKKNFITYQDVSITGRVVYDLFFAGQDDQSLHGIKRRGLKDIAEWMNIPTIREDTKHTATITLPRLKAYNESDVTTTFKLFSVYFLNQQTLAEMFGVPINMMLDASSSFLSNVFQAPELHEQGIVSDGMNKERHKDIYDLEYKAALRAAEAAAEEDDDEEYAEEDEGDDKKKKGVYEAAYVDIYQTGFFEFNDKVDYKGMYNAIEITANISPETTQIIKMLPYDRNGFKAIPHGKNTIYYIPDKRIGKIIVIAVNNSFDGVLRKKLKYIRETRFAIKQQMKTCPPEDLPKLESQQYGLKVVANIPSGYNGLSSARWGDIAVSILTVGIGRLLIIDTIKYIEAKYGGNEWMLDDPTLDLRKVPKDKFKVCIEVDTDGIYISKHVDKDELNAYLEERVKELLKVDASEMELDMDLNHEAFFFKRKTYVYYDEKNNLKIHGGAFKGSKQARCFDKALEKLVRCRLKHEGEPTDVINDILNIDQYSYDDLSLGTKLSKAPEMYEPGSLWDKLSKKAVALGQIVKAGTILDYIKTRGDNYDLAYTIKSRQEIDYKYYTNTLSRLIINFGFKNELKAKDTATNDEFMETDESGNIVTAESPQDDWDWGKTEKPKWDGFDNKVEVPQKAVAEKAATPVVDTKVNDIIISPKVEESDLDDWL